MDLNRDNMNEVFRQLRQDFRDTYEIKGEDTAVDSLSTTIPMSTATMRFDFLEDDPEFREWVGPRRAHQYASQDYIVDYKEWELTLAMKARDIRDDNIGLYSVKARAGGNAARLLKPREVMKALNDGASRTCYDGQNFFDTDHPVGEEGDVSLVSNLIDDGGAQADTPWYMMDTSRAIKPLLWLNRQDPEFQSFSDYTNLHTFTMKEFLFGGHAYGASHYGMWQTCFRIESTPTLAKIREVRLAMENLTGQRKNEDGTRRKLGIKANVIVCGSSNYDRLKVLTQAPVINSGDDPLQTTGAQVPNPLLGDFTLIKSSWLP